MTPIEIINAEMQKNPKNHNLEKIGHYLIDKGLQSIPEGKTLAECVSFCKSKAQKMASGGVAMVEDEEVYSWINEYYGIRDDVPATVSKMAPVESPVIDLANFF